MAVEVFFTYCVYKIDDQVEDYVICSQCKNQNHKEIF